MYHSRNAPLLKRVLSWYIGFILYMDFASHRFNPTEIREDQAVLLLANHFSWWDGFLMFHLNRRLFKKQFNVLVSEEEYTKRWYLKYLGCFAPEQSKKDVLETLLYAGSLLDDPNNLVLIFPQGKALTSQVNGINFEKGILQVINSSQKKFQIIFSASMANFFDGRKPSVITCLQSWHGEEYMSLQLLKSEYNKHYGNAVKTQNSSAL